jgi:very-short-patch-repair endonuclease
MNSKKMIGYSTLQYPIDGHKKILDEETFRNVYLNTDYTMSQVSDVFGISIKCMQISVKYYKQVIPTEIDNKVRQNYANSANRRVPSLRPEREVTVPKEQLMSMISEGKTEWAIAEELGIAAQTVRKNIRKYGLPRPSKRIFALSDVEWSNLEWANQLAPGLMESAYTGIADPKKFFGLLYDAFVALCRILWTVQKIGRRYSYYRERGVVERNHIGWRINQQEILLSEKLRELGVFHVREYFWAKGVGRNFSADIYIPQSNLLVEINGSVHSIGFVINHDKEKEKVAKKLGYKRVEVLADEVDKSLGLVLDRIFTEMNR